MMDRKAKIKRRRPIHKCICTEMIWCNSASMGISISLSPSQDPEQSPFFQTQDTQESNIHIQEEKPRMKKERGHVHLAQKGHYESYIPSNPSHKYVQTLRGVPQSQQLRQPTLPRQHQPSRSPQLHSTTCSTAPRSLTSHQTQMLKQH